MSRAQEWSVGYLRPFEHRYPISIAFQLPHWIRIHIFSMFCVAFETGFHYVVGPGQLQIHALP